MNEHMTEMVKRFPAAYIKDDGRGNAYVPHSIVTQRLIDIFGEPPKIEILRELYDDGKLTGVIMRLTVRGTSVEEAGEADNPQSKTNGARAKDACSDAIKRCAMRMGLGLHLWAQENYYLDTLQVSETAESTPGDASPSSGSSAKPGNTEPQAQASQPSQDSSPEPEPASPHAASPGSGASPWFHEALQEFGEDKLRDIAAKFSLSGKRPTLAQLEAALPEQQRDVLAELDFERGAKAGAKS